MSAMQVVAACLAATVGGVWIASHVLDWHIRRRNRRRWQQTARQAARTSTEPEQAECDTKFAQIIAAEYPTRTPHRRTEEDR
jgi:hypothetical protein